MTNDREKLNSMLAAVFPVLHRHQIGARGLRLLQLPAYIVENADFNTLRSLRNALPNNCCIVRYNDSLTHFTVNLDLGGYKDEYRIILADLSWSKTNPGDRIEEIQATFLRNSAGTTFFGKYPKIIHQNP